MRSYLGLAHGMCPHHRTAGFGIFWTTAGSRKRLTILTVTDVVLAAIATKSCYTHISHSKAVKMLSSVQLSV